MQRIKELQKFIRLMLNHFRWKILLIVLLGLLLSLFQGVGIVMIIPLLESFKNGSTSTFGNIMQRLNLDLSMEGILLLYFAVLAFFALFKSLQILFTQRTIAQFSNKFNIESIEVLLSANWEFFLKIPSSELMNLLKTESRSIRSLTNQIFQVLQNIILVVIQLVFACFISLELTLMLCFILGLLFFLQRFVFKKNFNLGQGQIGIGESLQKYLNETFRGIKLLKLHQLETVRSEEFKERIIQLEENELVKAKTDALSDLLYTLSGATIVIAIIYLSVKFDLLAMSALLVLLVLISRVIAQVNSLVRTTSYISNMLPSFTKFNEVLQMAKAHSSISKEKPSVKSIDSIELRNIHFSFGNKKILNDVNVHFEKGKFYVLTGPSGVGKTITSDLICGLITADSGDVVINGEIRSANDLSAFQASTSYVLQDTVLFGASIKDNITFFEKYSDDEILEAAHLAGLKPLLNKLPEGLDTLVSEDNRGFSGGEMQRISIARALIRKTPLIILDEVTNALDRNNEEIIINTLNEIKKNSIVILITHKEYLFDLADEVVRL